MSQYSAPTCAVKGRSKEMPVPTLVDYESNATLMLGLLVNCDEDDGKMVSGILFHR